VNAQEFIPQEIARAEQMRQKIHPLPLGEKINDVTRTFGLRHLVEKLIEVAHRFGRVRGLG